MTEPREKPATPRPAPERAASRKPARRPGAATVKPAAGVELGPLDDYIAFHLRLAQETALRAFTQSSGHPDFRPGLFAALMVVRLNPGISQSELGRAIGRDKSTISPLIRDLEARALVVRAPSSTDRRSVTLALTPAGHAELDSLTGHVEAHDRRLDAIVGRDKARLIALLRQLADALG